MVEFFWGIFFWGVFLGAYLIMGVGASGQGTWGVRPSRSAHIVRVRVHACMFFRARAHAR